MSVLSNSAGRVLTGNGGILRVPPVLPADITLSGPYIASGLNLLVTGNIHGHTTNSDGLLTEQELVDQYVAAGHDWIMISDHDYISTAPAGLVALIGNETSSPTGHIHAINAPTYLRGSETDLQTIIDDILADGGLVVLNHPQFVDAGLPNVGFTYAEIAALTDYHGLEIFNHGVTQHTSGAGYQVALWDQLLTNIRRDIWGFATDDWHYMTETEGYDGGRLRVFVASLTAPNIVASLEAGHFVADATNHGVTPGFPHINRVRVALTCPGATSIRFIAQDGLRQETAGETAAYKWRGDELYIRIEAVGDFTEGFGAAIDTVNRWGVIDGTWATSGGLLRQTDTASGDYALVLKRQVGDDFEAKVDVRLPTGTDFPGAYLMLLYKSAAKSYIVRLSGATGGGLTNTISLYRSVGGVNTQLAAPAFTVALDTWYRIRVLYTHATGRFQVKVWAAAGAEPGTWAIDTTDTTWKEGAFALRCGSEVDFDNLYINGFKTYYQPIPVGDWT